MNHRQTMYYVFILFVVWLSIGLSTSFLLDSTEFRCGDNVCKKHQKCVIEENRHKQLHFTCEDHTVHLPPHCVPNLLSAGKGCFCHSRICVDDILSSHISAITTTAQPVTTKAVQVHNHEFRCGGYVCHRHQKCVIEENRHKQLHFRCEDHSDHHTPHCVPNLLSAGKHCLCISRSCVDNILISLVSGHEVSGLICADHDDHFCHSNQVCEIIHLHNGLFGKRCVDRHHGLHECRHVPDVNEHCFCSTQECVFVHTTAGQPIITTTARPTTITPKPPPTTTTVRPTTTPKPTTTHKPTTTTQKPTTTTPKPTTTTTPKPTTTARPTTKTTVKLTTTHKPTTTARPTTTTPKPTTTARPTTTPKPTTTARPTTTPKPTTHKPTTTTPKPTTTTPKLTTTARPTTTHKPTTHKPTTTTPKPTTTTFKPTTTARPTTKTTVKLTTTHKPTTARPPTTTTAQPTTTTTVQPVTKTAVVCQDKPGVNCTLFNANFCANPYSNEICAKSCGHCTSVMQSALG